MDVILTTKCNRKCEGCCYLFNKYQEGEFFNVDKIIANIKKIKPAIEKHRWLSVIGGETFLYPDLVKVIDYVSDFDIVCCTIFTNGTIYPDYIEELCKAMAKNSDIFHIYIGNYGKPEVIKKLQTIFTQYGISHIIRPDDDGWVEHGDFINHNEEKIQFCDFRYSTLMKDKIYACGRFAQAVNLGLVKIEDLEECEYIDINDEHLLEKIDIMEEQSKYLFSKHCAYCLRGSKRGLPIPTGD